tara:strand:- start:274 stop:414 length:141 start_codon:yes stop_codon:yes gene_type:complete
LKLFFNVEILVKKRIVLINYPYPFDILPTIDLLMNANFKVLALTKK